MKTYMTEQRRTLLAFFKENAGESFAIDEVVERLGGEGISRSAVYRNVDKMAADGLLRKAAPDGSRHTVYQFAACGSHCDRIHLRCESCGKVFHMGSEKDEQALRSVLEKSGFELDEHSAVLPGLCKDCKK